MQDTVNNRMRTAGWMVALLAVSGCTGTGVELSETILTPVFDDQLTIRGRVCLEGAETQEFPVKIMFIVDCSGSLQQTDEGQQRVTAVQEVVRRYENSPNVSFSVIKFSGEVADLTVGFRPLSASDPAVFGPGGLARADGATDYQGALATAHRVLLDDMLKTAGGQGGSARLGRTKYVIIFFSDGTPDPVCAGCVADRPDHPRYLEPCPRGASCERDADCPAWASHCRLLPGQIGSCVPAAPCCAEDLHLSCTLMDDVMTGFQIGELGELAGLDEEGAPQDDQDSIGGWFPGLEGGVDYNQPYQIEQLIEEIMELAETFGVGEMRLHTALLYCRDRFGNPTSSLCQAAEENYNLDPERGRALLTAMASLGRGTFRDFTSGDAIDFLSIDTTSIRREPVIKTLVVSNTNALPAPDGYLPDSDADGLDDDRELRLGTDPARADSDGDGYGDRIESERLASGFDPLDAGLPGRPGSELDRVDMDGDGLLHCEEVLLGTDDQLADTDADGFTDRVEHLAGTDPLRSDIDEDPDGDGRRNADELLCHTDPVRADPGLWDADRTWYQLEELAPNEAGAACYGFTVRYLSLVTTRDRAGPGTKGFNDILLWFQSGSREDPRDAGNLRVACVRARYIAPDYKIPASAEVALTDLDFVDPRNLDLGFFGGSCRPAMEHAP